MSNIVHQHISLGLKTIASRLIEERNTVLDLGPLSTLTAPIFLQLNCLYFVEDVNEYVESLNVDYGDPIKRLTDFLLEKPADTTFDVILCWDLFNFLSLEVISHLMVLLKPYLKPGAVLHTIRYIGDNSARLPRKFKHIGQFNYEVKDFKSFGITRESIVPQAHTTIMLLRSLPEFSLYDTALNQDGMMKDVAEYLLEYDGLVRDEKVKRRLSSKDVVSYFSQQSESKLLKLIGLKKIFDSSDSDVISSVLDIGPKNGRQFNYLNERCLNLSIEDIYSSIAWQNKISGGTNSAISKQLLNFSEGSEFDIILLWDVLNYCSANQIQEIGVLFSKYLTVGSLLHLLIYKGNTIPVKPLLFEIRKELTVSLIGDVKNEKPRGLRSIAELMRFLPQFKLNFHHMGDKTNQHSYQEFILEYKG